MVRPPDGGATLVAHGLMHGATALPDSVGMPIWAGVPVPPETANPGAHIACHRRNNLCQLVFGDRLVERPVQAGPFIAQCIQKWSALSGVGAGQGLSAHHGILTQLSCACACAVHSLAQLSKAPAGMQQECHVAGQELALRVARERSCWP
eukprot:CAMPEP_0177686250 /NCGR_PEP_ID=MMETSP0447-20121125/33468_1 /TAXON_ID=0 /ORGANISM="Stygamoeba regulata, Strain BSH-02190019" /LENGTH=149 /DNA_ID=CAMNT_0019196359 /DNA_START=171 /DNA_END=620 /DNA_ORIENTATION=+